MLHGSFFPWNCTSVFPQCLWRLHWCLLPPPEAIRGDSSSRWLTGVKAGPWPAEGKGGWDQQRTLCLKAKGCVVYFSKSNSSGYKFYSTARLHVNVGFCLGAVCEVMGGEAANGEQRSSCIGGTARAQGSTWRTEPSDLLSAISPHTLLLSQENTAHWIHHALVLNMDYYSIIFTVSQHKIG